MQVDAHLALLDGAIRQQHRIDGGQSAETGLAPNFSVSTSICLTPLSSGSAVLCSPIAGAIAVIAPSKS